MTNSDANAVKPLGNYSKVRTAGGLIFVAGTTARQYDGTIVGVEVRRDGSKVYDVAEQTYFTLKAISENLAQLGASLEDCVDMTVFLTDMSYFDQFNAAYASHFSGNAPTRTTVSVAALPHPDMVVEIKAIACKQA